MKILIGYDLNKAGKNYDGLIGAIEKNFPTYWHCLDSTWIVETALTTVHVRDSLKSFLDSDDELLAVELGKSAAWTGFDTQCSDWLKNNL